MSYEISKELFEAVMNYDHKLDSIIISREFVTGITNTSLHKLFVNDFFFMCKEWALKQGYIIESYLDLESNGVSVIKYENKYISAKTEQQAVFDACMYILDNKDKQ